MSKFKFFLFFLILSLNVFSDSISISAENDVFANRDFDYTHGTKISYVRNHEDSIFKNHVYTSYSIFQFIYTPEKIDNPNIQENSRPWEGWLGFEMLLTFVNGKHFYNIGFNEGVIGPSSIADKAQKQAHKWVGAREPLGWHNQIEDRLAINFIYERGYVLYHDKWIYVIPSINTMVGTSHLLADISLASKIGWNVPLDYRGATIEPFSIKKDYSFYLSGKIGARGVAYNATIDKAPYASSEPFVLEGLLGVGTQIKALEISYNYVWRSSEYEDNLHLGQPYGNIIIRYNF